MAFSNHFADQLFYYGFDYLRMWRGRSVAAMGFVAILFFLCFEVNSWYMIKVIIEGLVAFWVVDQVNNFRESIFKPVPVTVTVEFIPAARPLQLTKHDFRKVPLKKVVPAQTLSHVIDSYTRPQRAKHLRTRQEIRDAVKRDVEKMLGARDSVIGGSTRAVIDDWVRI